MIRRLLLLAAVLDLALVGAAAAQDLAVVRQTAESAVLIDRQSVRRTGATAGVRTYAYARPAQGAAQIYVEVEEEYDCTALRARRRVLRTLDPQGRALSQENGAFGAWQPLTSVNVQVMVAVCQGQGIAGFPSAGSLAAFSQRMGAAPPAAARPAPAIAAARPAPRPAASTWRYVDSGRDDEVAIHLFDLASRRRAGQVVTVNSTLMLYEPVHDQGREFYWMDTLEEFDCAAHRFRNRMTAALDRDRANRIANDKPFETWIAISPDSVAKRLEEMVCQDARGADIVAVPDLLFMQRGERAIREAHKAVAAARSGTPAPARAATTPRYYVWGPRDAPSIAVLDLPSRRRFGNIVSLDGLILSRRPIKSGGLDYPWFESVMEVDCAAHRYRERKVGMQTADRGRRLGLGDDLDKEWSQVGAGSYIAGVEAFACRDVRDATIEAVPDLNAFQRRFLVAP